MVFFRQCYSLQNTVKSSSIIFQLNKKCDMQHNYWSHDYWLIYLLFLNVLRIVAVIQCHVVQTRLNRQFVIMAAPVKKRDVQRNSESRSSDDDDRSSSNSQDNEQEAMDEQVCVLNCRCRVVRHSSYLTLLSSTRSLIQFCFKSLFATTALRLLKKNPQ